MSVLDGERLLERTASHRAVLGQLLVGTALTRVQLADRTGLSKPTVHSIVGDLVAEGLAVEAGRTGGTVGRSATLFRINPTAHAVIGIDLGGTKTIAALADLTGQIRAEERIETSPGGDATNLVDRLAHMCRQLARAGDVTWSLVDAIAIGSPGVPDPGTGRMDLAANIPALADIDLARELAAVVGAEVILDNDVNMAILGERWHGLAQRCSDAVFIGLGTGLGMGILSDGELRRGSAGAAGEIGFLPLGGDPFDTNVHELGPLEEVLSSRGITGTYDEQRAATGDPPLVDVQHIFRAATEGNVAASRTIEATARHLCLAIAAVHAVLDPERVVLGGGIGANELLLRHVRVYLDQLGRRPPTVDVSALGERAALMGAVSEALRTTRNRLLGRVNHEDALLPRQEA